MFLIAVDIDKIPTKIPLHLKVDNFKNRLLFLQLCLPEYIYSNKQGF